MENKQTAVEWLYEKINSNLSAPMSAKFKEMFEQANKMFEDQIMDAHFQGQFDDREDYPMKKAEQYYNETYGK